MPPPAATQFSFESKELNKLNTEIEILLKWLLSAAARMAMATLTAAIKSANDSSATLSFPNVGRKCRHYCANLFEYETEQKIHSQK